MSERHEILISRFLSGNSSEAETKELENWRQKDKKNQAEFDRIKKIWELSYNLKVERDADVNAAWQQFQILKDKAPVKTKKPVIGYLRIAAGLALIACLSIVVAIVAGDSGEVAPNIVALQGPPQVAPAMTEEVIDSVVETPDTNIIRPEQKQKALKRNKKREVTNIVMITLTTSDTAKAFLLPDNSIVFLNEHSTIIYPENFSKNNRKLSLVGEAYFEVMRDTMQFIVSCNNTITRGTEAAFNINGYYNAKEVEVILASGSVEFSGVGKKEYKKLVLVKGDRATYDVKTEVISMSKNTRKDYKWWQKKNLRAKIKKLLDKIKRTFN